MSWQKDEIKGRAKEAAGVVTNDADLKREGKKDQLAADAKHGAEKAVDGVKHAAERAADSVKRAAKKVNEAIKDR